MPIIDIQRRFAEIGRIRAGAKNAKGHAMRLDSWRLTSANKNALEAAAVIYGGTVQKWAGSPTGSQYELYTETNSLEILVPPGASTSLWYEVWSGGGCERRCDGEHDHLNDIPCSCNPEARECKPTMRVSLCLYRLPGVGVWRYESHGYYAATEIPQTVEFLANAADRGHYITGMLRLEERMSKTKKDGTRKYLVPVLDLDYSVGQMAGITPVETPTSLESKPEPAALSAPASEKQKRALWKAAVDAGLSVTDLDGIISEVRTADTTISDVHSDEIDQIMTIINQTGETA